MDRRVLYAVAALMGCSHDSGPHLRAVTEKSGALVEVLTVNGGLAPGVVPLATPRTLPFAHEIGGFRGYGLVCLQEIWRQDSVDATVASLGLPSENVYHVDTRGENEEARDVCAADDVKELVACAKKRCGGEPPEETAICAVDTARGCLPEAAKLYARSPRCVSCLVASVGGSIDEMASACVDKGGASRAYGGQNGVILASRWPLRNREVLRLPSSGVNRVALFATLDVPGSPEPVEVACTHLSTLQPLPPMHPKFRTWEEEQVAQFDLVSERLRARAGSRPQLLVGDLNAGPARGRAVEAASEGTWKRILAAGFASREAIEEPPFCTNCADNSLRHASHSYLIDHVLARDPEGRARIELISAQRILDRKFLIKGYRGEDVATHLSDHYGLVVRILIR